LLLRHEIFRSFYVSQYSVFHGKTPSLSFCENKKAMLGSNMPAWLPKSPPQAQSTRSACTCGKISEDTNALAVVMLLKEFILTNHWSIPSCQRFHSSYRKIEQNSKRHPRC
jgi:hypothetical protein